MSASMVSYYVLYLVSFYTLLSAARMCWKHLLSVPSEISIAPTVTVFELFLFVPNMLAMVAVLVLPWYDVHSTLIIAGVWLFGLSPAFILATAAFWLSPEKVCQYRLLTWIFDICIIETKIKRPRKS